MATGGIGRVYEFTTNSAIATGDGISMAYEMGADIKNLSYVQFHPTAFNNRQTRECFLATFFIISMVSWFLSVATLVVV